MSVESGLILIAALLCVYSNLKIRKVIRLLDAAEEEKRRRQDQAVTVYLRGQDPGGEKR